MIKKNFNKIFLMALSEPDYARVDFWRAEQKDSKYSKINFVRKLIDAHDDLLYKIEKKEAEFKALNPDAGDPNYGLPLVYETDHELSGHVKKSNLHELSLSIIELTKSFNLIDDKKPQIKNIQPIHWLKGEESLRQFLQSIKKAGLIESRDTDEIIQEHFLVDGQEPTKEPQPIIWKSKKVLLAHLIGGLDSSLKTDHLWKTLAPHFQWKGKVPTGLRQSYHNNPYPNNIDVIQDILKKIKESK